MVAPLYLLRGHGGATYKFMTPAEKCSHFWSSKYPELYAKWIADKSKSIAVDILLAQANADDRRAWAALDAAWKEIYSHDSTNAYIFAMLPDVDDKSLSKYISSCEKVISKFNKLNKKRT